MIYLCVLLTFYNAGPTVFTGPRGSRAAKWRQIWGATGASYPDLALPLEGACEQLRLFLLDETRWVAGAFKEHTAASPDARRPRHLRLLSDEALLQLHAFMWYAEAIGIWAKEMKIVIATLLGKPSGGWCLIG